MAKKLSKALASVVDWFGRRAEDSFTFYDASKRTVSWEAGHEHLVHALLGNKNPAELKHTARLLRQMFKVIGVPANIKSLPTPPAYNGHVQIPVHLLREPDGSYTMDAAKADAFIGLSLQNAALAALQTPHEYATSITAGKTKGATFDLPKYLFTLLNVERVSKLLSELTPGYMKFVQKYKDEQFDQNYTPVAEDAGQHLRLLDLLTRLIRFPKHIGEDELEEFKKPLEAIGRLLATYDGGIPLEQKECLEMAKKMARIVTDFVPAPPPPPPSPGPPQPDESSEEQAGDCDEPQEGEAQPDTQAQSEEATPPEESDNNPEDDWNKPDSQSSDADKPDEDDPFADTEPQSTNTNPDTDDEESDDDEEENDSDSDDSEDSDADSSDMNPDTEEGDGDKSEQEHDEPGEAGEGEADEDAEQDEESPSSDEGDSDEPEDAEGKPNESEGESDAESTESGNADSETDNEDDSDSDDDESNGEDANDSKGGTGADGGNSTSSASNPGPESNRSPQNKAPRPPQSIRDGNPADDTDSTSSDSELVDDNENENEESDAAPKEPPVGDSTPAGSDSDQPDDGESDEDDNDEMDGDGTSPADKSDEMEDETDNADPESGDGDSDAVPDLDADEPDPEESNDDSDDDSDSDDSGEDEPASDESEADPEENSGEDSDDDKESDGDSDEKMDADSAEAESEEMDSTGTLSGPAGKTSASKTDAGGKAEKAPQPAQEDPAGEPAEPLPTPPSRQEREQELKELAQALGAELFDKSEELNADETKELNNAFGEITTVPIELTPEEQRNLDMDQTGVVAGDKLYVNWNIEPGDKEVYQSVLKRIDLVKAKVLQKLFTQKKKEQEFVNKGMKSGRFDTNKLVEAKQGVPTVYERQGTVTTNKICVGVLIDESGSMFGGHDDTLAKAYADAPRGPLQDEAEDTYNRSNKIGKAQQAAIFLNECFGKLSDVQFFVYGHSADMKRRPDGPNNGSTDMYVYREPGTRTSPHGLGSVRYRGNNRDGHAILLAAMRIRKFTQDPAILVVISDGQPSATGYGGKAGVDDTRHQVTVVERMGFQVIQVAIEPNVPSEQMFTHFVKMTDIKTLPGDLVKYMIRKLSSMIKTKTTL